MIHLTLGFNTAMEQNPSEQHSSFIANCNTRDGYKPFDLSPSQYWFQDERRSFIMAFRAWGNNASYSYLSRTRRALNEFFKFLEHEKLPPTNNQWIFSDYLRRYREHIYLKTTNKQPSTITSDYSAFKSFLEHCQTKGIFPQCQVPLTLNKTDNFDWHSNNERHGHLGPSASEFLLLKSHQTNTEQLKNIYKGPLTNLSPFASDEEFLDAYYTDQRHIFDLIRDAAIKDVKKAIANFQKGQKLIKQCDIEHLRRIYKETGKMEDTDLPQMSYLLPKIADKQKLDNILRNLHKSGIFFTQQYKYLRYHVLDGLSANHIGSLVNRKGAGIRQAIRKAKATIETLPHTSDIKFLKQRLVELSKFHRSKTGQHISFFSPKHPNGLSNLLGWAWHENYGMISVSNSHGMSRKKQSFPGAHWSHEYNGINSVRSLLGLTMDIAVACAVIIIGEMGVNVTSLQQLKIKKERNNIIFLSILDNEEYARIRIDKLRKGREVIKAIHITESEQINAYSCLKLILLLTDRMRQKTSKSNLWLTTTTNSNTPDVPAAQAWKSAWYKFLNRHPELNSISIRKPQLYKIRGTGGILAWFESGGDREEAAKFLGNHVSTSVCNYLPKELQDVFYRRLIRRFQNILIATVTAGKPYAAGALHFTTEKEVDEALKQILNDPTITDERLLSRIRSARDPNQNKVPPVEISQKTKYGLIWSPDQIALVLLFRDYLHKIKSSTPSFDYDSQYDGLCPALWLDLAIFIDQIGKTSMDRGYRITYKKALKLKEEMATNVKFPPLTKTNLKHV